MWIPEFVLSLAIIIAGVESPAVQWEETFSSEQQCEEARDRRMEDYSNGWYGDRTLVVSPCHQRIVH